MTIHTLEETAVEEISQTKPAVTPTHGPLFVVGMWRSGTSLFYALINQHPQISLLYEDELPLLWPLFIGGKAKADWAERWEFWNQALSRHKIDISDLPRQVSGMREASEQVWRRYAPDQAIRGCKSPNYFDCLPRLAEEFPDARFIVIWRDPTDVCRSVIRARTDSFFAKRGMVQRALLGCRDLKSGYDALNAKGMPVHGVQYEELVSNPDAVMQGVCRFLGVDFDRRMVSLKNADRSAIYDASHHEMVNSEKIRAEKKKVEVLSEDVRRKIARYISYWKKESGGIWPCFPEKVDADAPALSFGERVFDRLLYRGWRAFDQTVAFAYCYLPLKLLRKYRATKEPATSDERVSEKRLAAASQKN